MMYYSFSGESDLGVGTVYVEVDPSRDIVTRQAERYGATWRHGAFDGEHAVGHIADQNASELRLTQEEEIPRESFEEVWKQANERNRCE